MTTRRSSKKSSKAKASKGRGKAKIATTMKKFPTHAPITIGGGGSVLMDFNHNWFKPDPQDPSWHRNPNDRIVSLGFEDNTPNGDPPAEIPLPGYDCTIIIECTKSNGTLPRTIEITGSPFGVRFIHSTFAAVGNSNRYHRAPYHHLTGWLTVRNPDGTTHGRYSVPRLCTIRAEDL